MTRQEAVDKWESKFWQGMKPQQIAEFQLFEERLCMPWEVFHEAVEKSLARPVFTHEFARCEALQDELRRKLAVGEEG